MPHFEVIVGNIGTVFRGDKIGLAIKAYREYEAASREPYGRAAGEPVREYAGTLEEE